MALTISLALAAGLFATVLAQHLRIPGIVLLLATGAILGPDLLGIIRPDTLGDIMPVLVGYAVAIILFEGGMNLNLKRLLKESASIKRLITFGSIITAAGGATAATLFMGWSWQLSVLFGALVIVTGPTVITPLLRRIKINHKLETILEAEGVLIDPIGAIIAIVALEIVIHPSGGAFTSGLIDVFLMLGIGVLLGLGGGFFIAYLLKPKNLIPEGLENIFVLASVLALFHICNEIQPESGIASVTVAGLVVGNFKTRALRDLMEFKEQLTVMLIAMLFVLLAADIRFSDITDLGWPGVMTVVTLMFIVRPLNVAACTINSGLKVAEKSFLAWLSPRGIVAAAVASFVAVALDKAGIAGSESLRALVFLVIASTVLVQGLSGGLIAQILKVKRITNKGYAILGAHDLARILGRILRSGGHEIVLLDSNPDSVTTAKQEDFKVIFGNALEERTILRANLGDYIGCIGLTTNEEVNLMFVNRVRREFKTSKRLVALHLRDGSVSPAMIKQAGASILFGVHCDLDLWSVRIRRGLTTVTTWQLTENNDNSEASDKNNAEFETQGHFLMALSLTRADKIMPFDNSIALRKDDILHFLMFSEKKEEAANWLIHNGWEPVEMDKPLNISTDKRN
ncbi:MAG: sodium:proton antiporter [candidate division Zixibacteria bacterium]|nr:sodium:proton antiporter [candidate division Zixibacteria bacterium]